MKSNLYKIHDEMSFFKIWTFFFFVKIIWELSKHCAISIYSKYKTLPCSITIDKFVLRFSPVLEGSTIGGLDSLVFNLFSESTLSSKVLFGSSKIGFSSSPSLTMVSLSWFSEVLTFSLSVGETGASWTTIYWF